jgi:hypothetical protein
VWYGEANPDGIARCSTSPNAPLVIGPVALTIVGIPRKWTGGCAAVLTWGCRACVLIGLSFLKRPASAGCSRYNPMCHDSVLALQRHSRFSITRPSTVRW